MEQMSHEDKAEQRKERAKRAAAARWKGSTPESRREYARKMSRAQWGDQAEKNRRDTMVVSVRIPKAIYDRYCRCAFGARPKLRVGTVLRHILTFHAPSS